MKIYYKYMKNFIKKIIVGILTFATLFVGQLSFASTTGNVYWNTLSNDCSDIAIANDTQHVGFGNPCWVGSNVSANAGDVIKVRIYYHNTGNETANDTVLKIYKSGSGTNYTFSGRITWSGGTFNSVDPSAVYLTIPSGQTLDFVRTEWYPNQTTSNPNISGNGILNNGLSIGNIASGWGSQGTAMAIFKVSNNTNPPQVCNIDSFTANPTSITSGQSSTLSWNTTNCTSVKLNGSNVGVDGSQTVSPTSTTTYTLTAFNATSSDDAYVTVHVSQQAQMTGNISTNPHSCSISAGQSSCGSKITWNTVNPVATSSVTHNGATLYVGNNGADKTISVNYGTQTYFLYNNGILLDQDTATASCETGLVWDGGHCKHPTSPTMTGYINANPTTCYISAGQNKCSTNLTWNTTNPQGTSQVTYNSNGNPTVLSTGNNGSVNNLPVLYGSRTYFLYNSGIKLDETTVNGVCVSGSSFVDGYCKQNVNPSSCKINSFYASPSQISHGSTSTLHWSTSDCDYAKIENVNVTPVAGGSQTTGVLYNTKTYTLVAGDYGTTGSTVSAQTTVTVTNNNPTTCIIKSFYANPTSVTSGQMSTLYWNTEGCTTIRLNGNLVNNPNGSQNVYPNSTTTYTLDAENAQGIGVGAQATVSVVNNPNNNCRITQFDASDTSISEGDYSRLTWDTEGCDKVKITDLGFVNLNGSDKVYPTSDKTYTITAYDEDGSTITDTVRIYVDEEDEEDSCQIDSFTTSDNYINSGDRITLRWRTTGCDDVSISRIGDVDNDGSEDVYPYDSTTYTLRARGNGDSDSDTVNITVGNDDRHYNGNVVTTVATGVSQTGAQLNGYLTGSNTGNANVYFEYGTTVNLGQRTSSRYAGSNYFNDYISGLSPKTIYYFRAVSNSNSSGVQYGAIEVFQTPGNQVIYYNNNNTTTTKTTKVIQGVTVIGTESPIVLRIENRYQTVGIGDVIDYTVFYKNISNMRLANPMVQVYIPKGITLLNASVGSYSEQDRILSVPLNDLYGDDEGVIYLQGRVDSIDNNLAQIVSTAVIAYTTPNGAQQNAMAYVFNSPRINNMNVLGASVFGSGLFLGMNLVGWLLLITFILLLVLLVRSFYSHKETVVSTIHHQ